MDPRRRKFRDPFAEDSDDVGLCLPCVKKDVEPEAPCLELQQCLDVLVTEAAFHCAACGKEHTMPVVTTVECGDTAMEPAPTAATMEVLERTLAVDRDCKNVATLESLKHMARTLGHPIVLRRAMQYLDNIPCPACDPDAFGMSRACAAVVLAHGWKKFVEAEALVDRTLALIIPKDFLLAPR